MNCKQGDLAVIVRSMRSENLGKVVRVESLDSTSSTYGVLWNIAYDRPANLAVVNLLGLCTGQRRVSSKGQAPDSWLRPIRDPGDDAVDETLLRLPSPRQEVTA